MASPERIDYQRTAMGIAQVASEFNMAGHISESRALCEAAYRLVEKYAHGPMLTNIALQIAELSAQLNDAANARLYLGRAESWVTGGHENAESVATARVNMLFARGRTLTRLADQTQPGDEALYREAYDALESARAFGYQHRLEIKGQVDLFLADVSWWLGRTAVNLGNLAKACEYLKAVRSDVAMANRHFRDEVVSRAWLLEAESLALAGRAAEAADVAAAFIADARLSEEYKKQARQFESYLNTRIRPMLDWFNSPDAADIARDCCARGLRKALAEQVRPLVGWWHDWREEKSGIETLFFDFWGHGGFSCVAAAVLAKAHAAITVDARTVDEIREWARILCPLFETVIIKWKGELGSGMVIVPQHADYAGAGGHGYAACADRTHDKRYVVSMSWANPIPPEVTTFLAHEALPLFSAGRLLVLPAPLVGCSQSAVGWTDDLLLEGLLGGVVDVTMNASSQPVTSLRVLDLSRVRLPFIDKITMGDLASVLDDTERWIGPLRSHVMKALASGDLNNERWASIRGLEHDIQDACRELTEGWSTLVGRRDWRISHLDTSLAAGSRGPSPPPVRESITGLLKSVASDRGELAPWIPYWRLQDRGGYLNWTCPLDNQSTPPDHGTMLSMASMGVQESSELHSWLYPGTGGWFIPVARRSTERARI